MGWLTLALIVACFGVSFLTGFGADENALNSFNITEIFRINGQKFCHNGLPEVRHGELWRLMTPSFVHFSPWHLIENAVWFPIFGTLIEKRQGAWKLAGWVLLIGVVSNFAEYLRYGPGFGGFSGVISGLFGFIWMRNRFDPASRLQLNDLVVWGMLIWLGLCVSGLMAHVAWAEHLAGLLAGCAGGILTGLWATKPCVSDAGGANQHGAD